MAEAPGLERQRREVEEAQRRGPAEGETWYLIDQWWFECWAEYVEDGDQNACTNPGPIDNSKILEDTESQRLKANQVENEDYVLLHSDAWHKLVSWYGQTEGQAPIERKVVKLSSLKVEVYLVDLALCQYSHMDELVTLSFSRADTIDTIHKEARRVFEVPAEEETRMWMRNSDGSCERLRNPQSNVNGVCLCSGQTLILESRNEDGTWPTARPHVRRNSVDEEGSYYQGQPGVCGLSNLGNTCFINSALQCLSGTPPLTEYFLSNAYVEELNLDNPLGMHGEIAETYADLIKQMWSGHHYTVIPRMFKVTGEIVSAAGTGMALYEILLDRLARYVSRPSSEDEEEEGTEEEEAEEEEAKEEEGAHETHEEQQQTNGLADEGVHSPAPDPTPDPDTTPEPGDDHRDPSPGTAEWVATPEPEGVRSEPEGESERGGPSPEKRPLKKRKSPGSRKPLFTFQTVNVNGITERGTNQNTKPDINSQLYIALDWDSDMKKRYYNEMEAEKYIKDRSMGTVPRRDTVTLKECIELFTTKEILEEGNPWYCPACKEHQLATKKFDLWSLPEVLIIHLKRFSYTRLWKEKLDTLVDFPLRDLDLSEFLINPKAKNSKYDLIAVSNHYGGLRDGHYTTIARNKDDGRWYHFDDSKVTFASMDHMVTSAAYVLFYQLQDKISQPADPGPCPSQASVGERPSGDEETMDLD
ncbi:ubiquitin carboxyl-terminal hydrolase 11-like [Heterodontus francisci]|uniref:ubiquitin carboxyl-terminal hydrolase 11-like n=1 Tax=Heterodontus francisci TaxID=7792 RepID=UPI00355BFECB